MKHAGWPAAIPNLIEISVRCAIMGQIRVCSLDFLLVHCYICCISVIAFATDVVTLGTQRTTSHEWDMPHECGFYALSVWSDFVAANCMLLRNNDTVEMP